MMTPPSVGSSGSENSPHSGLRVPHHPAPSDGLWREGTPVCSKCGNMICDEMIQRFNGKLWHSACLRCTSCQQPLRHFCFAKGDELYCEEDFTLYFGSKCAGCNTQMNPTEIVRKLQNNVYHQACFSCLCCQMELQTGDKIYLRDDNKLLCEMDYHRLKQQNASKSSCGLDSDSDCSTGSGKRLRTNISSNQINILNKAYQQDTKPSRHVLRQLGIDTGLDTRVVRVWFQNKRAKEKRTIPANSFSAGQGHENNMANSMDDDSCGSFTGSESCSFNRTHDERNTCQLTQGFQTKTPPCGSIGNWINFLDTLSPESIPPNIELKACDIKNGEVCMNSKLQFNTPVNTRYNFQNSDGYTSVNSPWLPSL